MFDDSRPSIAHVNDIEQVNELRAYLGRPHRLRPLAVATPQWGCDEPSTSAERLVGRGFDVAIVEPGSARERLNERMPRELEIRRGGLRLFSSAGGLGAPELASRYCYFDSARPGVFAWVLDQNIAEILAAESSGGAVLAETKPASGVDPAKAKPAAAADAAPASGTEAAEAAPDSASRPQPSQRFSPGTFTLVEDEAALDALAAYILDEERQDPVVVVSRAGHQERPFVDCEELARRLEESAAVVYVPLTSLTWRLSSYLPGGGVYGGAARLYPPGGEAAAFDERYLYRMYDRDAGPRVIDRVVADAMDLVVYDYAGEVRENNELRAATVRVQQVLPTASCALGTLYREGFGVPRNLAKAKALYQEAAAAGVERAGELLADFPNHPHAPHGQDAEEEP